MSLADVIFNALTGQSGAARPSFDQVIQDVAQERAVRGISRRQLAKETGIPESTLRRWEKGQRPSRKSGASATYAEDRYGQLVGAHRHLVAVGDNLDRWRNHRMVFSLQGVKQHTDRGGDRSSRTVSGSKLALKPGTGDRIVDAFLAGDDRRAAAELAAGIQDDFYWDVFNNWIDADDSDYVMGVTAS